MPKMPSDFWSTARPRPTSSVALSDVMVGWLAIWSRMSVAIVTNACSTFCAFFADVSRYCIPCLRASSYCIVSSVPCRNHGKSTYRSLLVVYDSLVHEIALVTQHQLLNAFARIAFNLAVPDLHILERVGIGDISHDANTVSAAIVG